MSGAEGTLGIWRVLHRSTPQLCQRSEVKGQHASASSFWEGRDEIIQAHGAGKTSSFPAGSGWQVRLWVGEGEPVLSSYVP